MHFNSEFWTKPARLKLIDDATRGRVTLVESAVFGMLQGVFEWLPISSTGELYIIMTEIFGYAPRAAADLSFFLHIGTVCSAILYFRGDVKKILVGLCSYKPGYGDGTSKLLSFLIISTLLSGALGYLIFSYVSEAAFSGEFLLGVVGIALIATGIILKMSQQTGTRDHGSLTLRDTVLLGAVQAFSAIPGLSRSGLTISAFLMRGYTATESLRLSFLMGIPAILAAQAGILVIYGLPKAGPADLAVGLMLSFAFGYASIRFLMGLAARVRFWWFAIIMGAVALLSFAGLF